jgi:hypothetical protein
MTEQKCPSLLDDNVFANLFTFTLKPEDNPPQVSDEVKQQVSDAFGKINALMEQINQLMTGQPVEVKSGSVQGEPTPVQGEPTPVQGEPEGEGESTPTTEGEPVVESTVTEYILTDVNDITPDNISKSAEDLKNEIERIGLPEEKIKAQFPFTKIKDYMNTYNKLHDYIIQKSTEGIQNTEAETKRNNAFENAKKQYNSMVVNIYNFIKRRQGGSGWKGKGIKSAKKVVKRRSRSTKRKSAKRKSSRKSAKRKSVKRKSRSTKRKSAKRKSSRKSVKRKSRSTKRKSAKRTSKK